MSGASPIVPIAHSRQKALFIGPDGIQEHEFMEGLPPTISRGEKNYDLMCYGYRVGVYFQRIQACQGGTA